MKKEIYVHIAQPCHEDWAQMSPVQQGRFCESCCKKVIDFTGMSDQQVLNTLSANKGSTCGRFLSNQLERPISIEATPYIKPYKFFLSAFIPAFLLANANKGYTQVNRKLPANVDVTNILTGTVSKVVGNSNVKGTVLDESGQPLTGVTVTVKGTRIATATDANGNFTLNNLPAIKDIWLKAEYIGFTSKEVEVKRNSDKPVQIKFTKADAITLGDVVVVGGYASTYEDDSPVYTPEPKRVISGKVINEAGEPVPFASIKVNTKKSIVADSNGVFAISVNHGKKRMQVTASSVGYQSFESNYDIVENNTPLSITLRNDVVLPEASVSCSVANALSGMVGGISIVRAVTIRDTANTFIQKVFRNEMFKVYPNPAQKGSPLTLNFKKAGSYSVQLFDNSGKLYAHKEFLLQAPNQTATLPLPRTITSGAYYLKAVNTSTSKQYIDKLIVQ